MQLQQQASQMALEQQMGMPASDPNKPTQE
jgi:hypothetical protein